MEKALAGIAKRIGADAEESDHKASEYAES